MPVCMKENYKDKETEVLLGVEGDENLLFNHYHGILEFLFISNALFIHHSRHLFFS